MYLTKLIILNNKSCKKIIIEPSKIEPEVFIGVNDCGKTTILKSLDIFFNEKASLNFIREDQQKSDLSNSFLSFDEINSILRENSYPNLPKCSGDVICIFCEFEIENADTDADFQESSKNLHLKWSITNNKITLLRILNNPESGAENFSGYYLLSKDFKDDEKYLELWNKTKADLALMKKKFSVTEKDIKNENGSGPFKNIENLLAIYGKNEKNLEVRWSRHEKYIQDKNFFPSFKYFDWNFSLKELEDIATEAMNKVTGPLLQEIKELAVIKQSEALEGVNSEFKTMMGDLKDDLPKCIKTISSSVFFNVEQKITDIKLTKANVDGEIHIDNQGDGIKRQIWFALLKWRSKLTTEDSKKNKYIWCFDEPETHLYPLAQRQLFDTFKDMCLSEFQILLSTHSTIFVDRTKIKDINQVVLSDGYSEINQSESVDDLFDCLGIKNSDFLFFDKFLAVEGATEYELIPRLYKLKYERTLNDDGIQIIDLKGKDQAVNNKDILEGLLDGFQKIDSRVFYLFDNDAGIMGSNVFNIGTYDLEDAISNDIWINFIKINCGINLTEEILNIKIRNNLQDSSQKKFHKLLMDYVAKNVVEGKYLPSKGCNLGRLIADCIVCVEKIPKKIDDVFNALNS